MLSLPAIRLSVSTMALSLATALWAATVVAGSWTLWNHAAEPGMAASAPARWPSDSRLTRNDGRPVLVMFAHPKCPCTRASIRELDRLLAQTGRQCDAVVLFVQPAGTSDEWPRTDTWQAAAAIPGVQVQIDQQGAEARRFGAMTSGQVLLYDADGSLAFQGGITAARGHEGDNPGRAAVVALMVSVLRAASRHSAACSGVRPRRNPQSRSHVNCHAFP
jgi:hypothetical protein